MNSLNLSEKKGKQRPEIGISAITDAKYQVTFQEDKKVPITIGLIVEPVKEALREISLATILLCSPGELHKSHNF